MKTKTIKVHEVVIRLEVDEREVRQWEDTDGKKPLPPQIAQQMVVQMFDGGEAINADSYSIEVDGKVLLRRKE